MQRDRTRGETMRHRETPADPDGDDMQLDRTTGGGGNGGGRRR